MARLRRPSLAAYCRFACRAPIITWSDGYVQWVQNFSETLRHGTMSVSDNDGLCSNLEPVLYAGIVKKKWAINSMFMGKLSFKPYSRHDEIMLCQSRAPLEYILTPISILWLCDDDGVLVSVGLQSRVRKVYASLRRTTRTYLDDWSIDPAIRSPQRPTCADISKINDG
jgi:hypothetical protein